MNKDPLRKARYYYAAAMFRLSRGMSLISQARNIFAMPVYAGMFNLTILNPLGYNIPAKYMLYSTPLIPFVVILIAHLDLKIGLSQAEQDYIQRKTNPFLREMRGRIKNIEKYLADRFNGEFKEDWEWSDKDSGGEY